VSGSPRIVRNVGGIAGRHFDLVVVGGGIQGALCAVQAAHRGLGTLLIDAQDFGAGTSFSSLRTIHGGLRYLQWLDFARARRSAQQQRWWFEQFPELVQRRPCLMPLYRRSGRSRTAFRIAGQLARLAGIQRGPADDFRRGSPVEILAAAEVGRRWPGLPSAGLQGGALWHEGFMPESSRVIIECLRWAVAAGAVALNYVEFAETSAAGRGRARLILKDRVTGAAMSVTAERIINAAGSQAEEVARRLCGGPRSLMTPTVAWNLLLDARLPEETCLVLTPPARRSQTYFLQPFHGRLLAGTGHAAAPEASVAILPSAEAIGRMRADLDAAYPGARLGSTPVLRVFAGTLPGVRKGEARLAVRPRIERDVAAGGASVVHVVGVKFTEAPDVARQALDRLVGTVPRGPESRPTPGDHWDVLDPAHPATRESLRELAASESALFLEDLIERRTNAWCDETASSDVARLMGGALAQRAQPETEVEFTRTGSRK
jgi:glycerol-3-phosphate dehydrogenase